MQCVARRWAGTGTTRERAPNTQVATELEQRLAAMQSERIQQDVAIFPNKPLLQSPNLQLPNDLKNKQAMGK